MALSAPADAVAGNSGFNEVFPGVPLTREVAEYGTLLGIDAARQVLGFQPRHTWRNHVSTSSGRPR